MTTTESPQPPRDPRADPRDGDRVTAGGHDYRVAMRVGSVVYAWVDGATAAAAMSVGRWVVQVGGKDGGR